MSEHEEPVYLMPAGALHYALRHAAGLAIWMGRTDHQAADETMADARVTEYRQQPVPDLRAAAEEAARVEITELSKFYEDFVQNHATGLRGRLMSAAGMAYGPLNQSRWETFRDAFVAEGLRLLAASGGE